MTDDLVKRLRMREWVCQTCGDDRSEAADYIEYLECELEEERRSRETAAAKAWEFSERIEELGRHIKERDTFLVGQNLWLKFVMSLGEKK